MVEEAYALWDLLSPDTPIERFSGDEEGLQASMDQFDELERISRGPYPWLGALRRGFVFSVIVWAYRPRGRHIVAVLHEPLRVR